MFTAHGWSFTAGVPRLRAFLYRLAERATARFCDRIITVSEADRRLALGARVGRAEQVVTVHNGMPDVAPELRARRHHPALEGEGLRLLMVARFSSQKDHPTLLEAVARLARESAAAETGVHVVGGGA